MSKEEIKAQRIAERAEKLAGLVRDGKVIVIETSGKSKRKAMHPELVRLLSTDAKATVQAFLTRCKSDDALRRKAEAEGIDLEGWEEGINED